MKPLLITTMLLLLAGCLSPSKSSYNLITPGQFIEKKERNAKSRDYVWDKWRYAGSDADYDYLYEYIPGSIIPYSFKFYKIPRGVLNLDLRYEFDPDYGNNTLLM